MSGYLSFRDVLPCPESPNGAHDWLPGAIAEDDPSVQFECSWCAALASTKWWGVEFRTGLEHFEDFRNGQL